MQPCAPVTRKRSLTSRARGRTGARAPSSVRSSSPELPVDEHESHPRGSSPDSPRRGRCRAGRRRHRPRAPSRFHRRGRGRRPREHDPVVDRLASGASGDRDPGSRSTILTIVPPGSGGVTSGRSVGSRPRCAPSARVSRPCSRARGTSRPGGARCGAGPSSRTTERPSGRGRSRRAVVAHRCPVTQSPIVGTVGPSPM